ncbi:hypothetical protein K491DRAFT_258684 [Lophiostoma macrostomum CBS 122681]|uniref:Uncharacterized protein n=1 Tax=Lophiostoma macrostomum CBS 122681 TaxID=1314788 RepID=A0A6A6TGY1_9PLEO|nr:hypothetical protein K491DRAFT_258684 [Lophiostoma macrostomum CBS 122681]
MISCLNLQHVVLVAHRYQSPFPGFHISQCLVPPVSGYDLDRRTMSDAFKILRLDSSLNPLLASFPGSVPTTGDISPRVGTLCLWTVHVQGSTGANSFHPPTLTLQHLATEWLIPHSSFKICGHRPRITSSSPFVPSYPSRLIHTGAASNRASDVTGDREGLIYTSPDHARSWPHKRLCGESWMPSICHAHLQLFTRW